MHQVMVAFADDTNGQVYPQVEHMMPWADEGTAAVREGTVLALADGTRFTDVVTQAQVPGPVLVVSSRMDQVLRGFSSMACDRTPVVAALGRERRPYVWLRFHARFAPSIDWPQCRFHIARERGGTEPVVFDSEAAAAATAKALANSLEGWLVANRFAFVPGAPVPDLFVATLGLHDFFVSDRLAAALVDAGVQLRLRRLPGA